MRGSEDGKFIGTLEIQISLLMVFCDLLKLQVV